jgi:hypothetical protein
LFRVSLSVQGQAASGQVAPGATALAEIQLYDFAAQDGDIVRVSSGGYQVEVTLLNDLTTVVVPVDASRTINVTGMRDGSGGITMGVRHVGGRLPVPVMSEGQNISIPVNF